MGIYTAFPPLFILDGAPFPTWTHVQLLVWGGSLSQTGPFIAPLPLATIDPDIRMQGAWSQCKNRNAVLQPGGWREDRQFLEK